MPRAESDGRLNTSAAKLRLQTARRVIHPGMDDTGIVPALMGGQAVFLLQHPNGGIRMRFGKLHRGRKTDNAAANHQII